MCPWKVVTKMAILPQIWNISLSFPLQFQCCGSNSSTDWQQSAYILSSESGARVVPDSCCKTVTFECGRRDHPSNIYKAEVKCHFGMGERFVMVVKQSIHHVYLQEKLKDTARKK